MPCPPGCRWRWLPPAPPSWRRMRSSCSGCRRPAAARLCGSEEGMKVLVTGAAGFIGSHVAHKLLARGDAVVGLDNLNAYYDPTLKEARLARLTPVPGFRFVKLDLADAAGMAALFKAERFDRVVHLAAQ